MCCLNGMDQKSIYNVSLLSVTHQEWSNLYHIGDEFFSTEKSTLISSADIEAEVKIKHTGNVFSVSISYNGEVKTECNRCLDDVYYDVDFTHDFVVKISDDTYDEDDDIVTIPEKVNCINLAHIIREDIELSLPMITVHEDGECNPDTIEKLNSISRDRIPEDGIEKDENGIDERWAALKQLKKE